MEAFLCTEDLCRHFGGVTATDCVCINIEENGLRSIIGPNGAGKTTFINIVTGRIPASSGKVIYQGKEVQGRPAYAMAAMGMAYMPDDLRIFPDLTCEENLEIAARVVRREGYWNIARVQELFPVLRSRRKQKGLNMSGGEKKMLSLGRALMANRISSCSTTPSKDWPRLLSRPSPRQLTPSVRRE